MSTKAPRLTAADAGVIALEIYKQGWVGMDAIRALHALRDGQTVTIEAKMLRQVMGAMAQFANGNVSYLDGRVSFEFGDHAIALAVVRDLRAALAALKEATE